MSQGPKHPWSTHRPKGFIRVIKPYDPKGVCSTKRKTLLVRGGSTGPVDCLTALLQVNIKISAGQKSWSPPLWSIFKEVAPILHHKTIKKDALPKKNRFNSEVVKRVRSPTGRNSSRLGGSRKPFPTEIVGLKGVGRAPRFPMEFFFQERAHQSDIGSGSVRWHSLGLKQKWTLTWVLIF